MRRDAAFARDAALDGDVPRAFRVACAPREEDMKEVGRVHSARERMAIWRATPYDAGAKSPRKSRPAER